MLIKEIIDRSGALEVYERRNVDDNYCEIVFYTKDTDRWNALLTEILGQAVKPAGSSPSKDDAHITAGHRGIYKNQTLFRREVDGVTTIAMLWPWQDGNYTTLKIAVL
jgi:hypothetical protein